MCRRLALPSPFSSSDTLNLPSRACPVISLPLSRAHHCFPHYDNPYPTFSRPNFISLSFSPSPSVTLSLFMYYTSIIFSISRSFSPTTPSFPPPRSLGPLFFLPTLLGLSLMCPRIPPALTSHKACTLIPLRGALGCHS